jgi:hypothetical protein
MGLTPSGEEETSQSFLSLPYKDTEGRPCVPTKKRALIKNQICWHLDFGLASFQNCEK